MSLHVLTASACARAVACNGSLDMEWEHKETGAAAKKGIGVHSYLAHAVELRRKPDDLSVYKGVSAKTLERIDVAALLAYIGDSVVGSRPSVVYRIVADGVVVEMAIACGAG